MADVLAFLTYLAVILVIGVLASIAGRKIGIPNALLLIIAGIAMPNISYNGAPLIEFPEVFLSSISILALAMIVFDSSSRFRLSSIGKNSADAIGLSVTFLVLNLVFLTIFSMIIGGVKSVLMAVVFSVLMSGNYPAAAIGALSGSKFRILEILKLESLLSTPLVVLMPFIILDIKKGLQGHAFSEFAGQLIPLLQQFAVGIGSGVLVGIAILKFMKKDYSRVLSPLAVITASLLAYIIAENLKGSGVLAVASMGLLFGNMYLKQKFHLQEFSSVFTNSLEMLVFILIGQVIMVPFTPEFFVKSIILFILFILIRYFAVTFSLGRMRLDFKEKLFMSLNVQKGIAAAAVMFSLASLQFDGVSEILDLSLIFMLYSIVLSTIVLKNSKKFIKIDAQEEEE